MLICDIHDAQYVWPICMSHTHDMDTTHKYYVPLIIPASNKYCAKKYNSRLFNSPHATPSANRATII